MYETFFGLKRRPFLSVPDTESYFSVPAMEEARQTIDRTVRRGDGLSLLFGPSGTGKTLLLRLLRKSLESEYTVALITSGRLETPKAFFQQLLYELRLPFSNTDETELRLALLEFARQEMTLGVVLLVDEAQFLSRSVLEEIRLLMNGDDGAVPYFRAVLAGPVELEEKLTHPDLEAFNQRVVCRSYLDTLSREETDQYIAWQTALSRNASDDRHEFTSGLHEFIIHSAGGEGRRIDSPHIKTSEPIFTDAARQRIYQLTDGLPRLVNQLCDGSLRLAAERVSRQVDEDLVHAAWARHQQIDEEIFVSKRETISAATTNSYDDIDEIVSRKKATFQLKAFDSAVEFGTLDDENQAEEPPRSSNEYKPAYPGDEADEAEISAHADDLSEESAIEPPSTAPEPPRVCSRINQICGHSLVLIAPWMGPENREAVGDDPMPEQALETETVEAVVSEEDETEDNDFRTLVDAIDDEILFSSGGMTVFDHVGKSPFSEELTEAIAVVASGMSEEKTETVPMEEVPAETASTEDPSPDSVFYREPLRYPIRYRRGNWGILGKYQLDSSLGFNRPLSVTLRRFESTESWIGNVVTRLLFLPFRLPAFAVQMEPEVEEIVDSQNDVDPLVSSETDPEIQSCEPTHLSETGEPPMDQETLEKYGAEVLEGRPPFVRKEPNYAYQTTDSAPERKKEVPYPDPKTGSVILLNWSAPEHEVDCGFGTVYSEFVERCGNDPRFAAPVFESEIPNLAAPSKIEDDRTVRIILESDVKRCVWPGKTSFEETFDEISVVAPAAPASGRAACSSLETQGMKPTGLEDEIVRRQLDAAVRQITEAAKRIEQAAEMTEDAGRHVKRTAEYVETEVQAALPTYKDMFQELAQFQKTITEELGAMQGRASDTPHREMKRESGRERRKLLPFPRRPGFSPTDAAKKNPDAPAEGHSGNDKSIDVRTLFQ